MDTREQKGQRLAAAATLDSTLDACRPICGDLDEFPPCDRGTHLAGAELAESPLEGRHAADGLGVYRLTPSLVGP